MLRKSIIRAALLAAVLAGFAACGHNDPEKPSLTKEEKERRSAINTFAYNVMNTYYLWNEEISDGLSKWKMDDDPVEKVGSIRYKDDKGNDIDKWSAVTDDIEAVKSRTGGVKTTYGFDFKVYYTDNTRTNVCLVVTLTYPDSPAEKAGLKRGDVFLKIAGNTITSGNYATLIYDSFLYAPSCTLTDDKGKSYKLTAVEMYENPVLVTKVFNVGIKKIGYLFFNRFTLGACSDLLKAGRYFRSEGIDDLILDMRYNSGGYVTTETLLASMLAPKEEVDAGSVFETAVYNSILAKAWGEDATCFANEFSFNDSEGVHAFNLSGANPGIKHLYAILTGSSASASESILVGLMPYLDIKIFGQKSGGKYCTGIFYGAKDWYDDYAEELSDKQKQLGEKYAEKWGIYVMISRYADKNGNTPCMPDGFTPDYTVEDNPTETYPLGDEREAMLAAVLARLGGKAAPAASRSAARSSVPLGPEIQLEHDPLYDARILLH